MEKIFFEGTLTRPDAFSSLNLPQSQKNREHAFFDMLFFLLRDLYLRTVEKMIKLV